MAPAELLRTENLTRVFDSLRAVDGVSLTINEGELRSIIGPNGAGKSTLFRLIAGELPPTAGRIWFHGTDITGLNPHDRARRGLARTWQAIELFDDLTVRENLTVAANHPSLLTTLKDIFTNRTPRADAVDEALEVFALEQFADATPSELTQGQRKLVAVARALAARPKLLEAQWPFLERAVAWLASL